MTAFQITEANGGKRPPSAADLPLNREAAINRLLVEIEQFAAFPHLVWAIWCFKQAEDFPIDASEHDFYEDGFDRMALYYKRKSDMLRYLKRE